MSQKRRRKKTSSLLPPRPDAARVSRVVAAVALAAVLSVVAGGPASANGSAQPRVTVIGDSITASLDYVPSAKRYLGRGIDLRSDADVCRRLVVASCAFQGSTPETALGVIGSQGRSLGSVVVLNVGYNDWAAAYDVDRVMRALQRVGVRTAIWVTLRETTTNYAQSNARIRSAARRWESSLVVADWNSYSRGRPWFREDGLHLTASGAMALARLLRPLVVSAS